MVVARIPGATRVLGKAQGYLGLPVRDETIEDTPCMLSAWIPLPDELDRLSRGAAVHVRVLGTGHPPMLVEVGDVPDDNTGAG